MIESITDRVNGDAALVRRGRHVDLAFLIGVGDDDYIVEVAAGRVVSARKRALAATTGCFTIRGDDRAALGARYDDRATASGRGGRSRAERTPLMARARPGAGELRVDGGADARRASGRVKIRAMGTALIVA